MVFASLLRVNSLSFLLCIPMNRRYRSLHVIHPFRLHLSRISNLDYEFSIRLGGVGSRFLPHDFRVLLIILPFMPPPNRTLLLSLSIYLSLSPGGRTIVIKLSNETLFHPSWSSLYHGNSSFSELVLRYIPFTYRVRLFLKGIKEIRRAFTEL